MLKVAITLGIVPALATILAVAPALAAPPPDTRAILGTVGKVVSANGIDEAKAVEIGGIQQWITVRGKDRRNPILLVIHGGPAAPELPTRYLFEAPWTDYFTVVEWDQRGSGKTYLLNDPAKIAPTLSADRIVRDAEELVGYLRATYGKQKVFAIGHSWGTIIGLNLAARRPDWLYAYIGAGQIIDTVAAEKVNYAWVLDEARRRGEVQALKELEGIAPYPEKDGSLPIDKLGTERKWSVRFGGLTYGRDNYDYWENAERISPDYSDADFKAIDQGSGFSLPKLLPDLAGANFTGLTKLDCPVIIFAGRHDYTTPSEPVQAWFRKLSAPSKRFVWFENSAHMMYGEEPGRVLVHLVQDARPLAAAVGDVAPEVDGP
ncbi:MULTISPECIES: alpha/beta fold hydrolase [Nitrospirillum]|uniref:Pimeloyl-ACP methyl ester carboxylesterase n=1 Tax=Nitrospirillum amazonense TaxID=28077 RepID=A0A560G9P8_9PROT|nr:alpha/beta hydrolase [Nitrospirillum amazonense]MEC4593628.1 alpha/beta hydrolase [Nitrospirillum amazonense]TWB30628.1 pimeloyl-ACP methyl ester carboxylesterase [Nitrospirillum amazonense]